ncbi:MAG TPA: lipoate--protein ligase [Caldisericia bacterium]|nr:lipoate--protein ligase [Caldisericia bacterium]HPB33223.1 lipoate--protein ligase [Caldisericia bacterium]HQL67296.1 lipoate--protein ligase [Caldisericia bacterium]HQN47996.1 lipoate--protein ligase [Caldisericia bacterium]HQO99080.1 lipoate--protein ligase [Caldisericia bacterium]
MIYIKNSSTDPYFNLAFEEYFLRYVDLDDTIFSLWRSKPSVVVGKHQNTFKEINHKFVSEHNILVARRITGGGTVYHDLGNLNFTLITKVDHFDIMDIKAYIIPIVQVLNKMGINAQLSERNSITIDGKKISGTAEAFANKKLLCHGTLLFDTDINILNEALKVKETKIESKSVKSVPGEVTNIKDFLGKKYDILTFENKILAQISSDIPFREYSLNENDIKNIEKLAKEKFSTWDWIYGESPPFIIRNTKKFPYGNITFSAKIERGGIVKKISFEGDIINFSSITYIEQLLQGKKYECKSFKDILKNIKISKYFGNITLEELLSLLFY